LRPGAAFPALLAAIMLAAIAALMAPTAQAQRLPGALPQQPDASSGGVIPPVSPVAPQAVRPDLRPALLPVPSPPQGVASPACQIPVEARSPDLRAYCAARGQ
jgi:hypothetical protein